jgi:hypothetical protein
MVSWGGNGSSSPRPIISQAKLPSSRFMPIFRSGNPGDSSLNPQRSVFAPSTMFVALKSPAVRAWSPIPLVVGCPFGKLVDVASVLDEGSCVLRSCVSTCSMNGIYIKTVLVIAKEFTCDGSWTYSISLPKP